MDGNARSLGNPEEIARRRALLENAHVAPLTTYVARLRAMDCGEVPDFDPLDGGTAARAWFLFEKPGPKTSEALGGSSFISRDNDDPTARATLKFMHAAGIPRAQTVIWNTIPWWNFTRSIAAGELGSGAMQVQELISHLPELRVVILVGKKAATRAKRYVDLSRYALIVSDHPSPLVRARWPQRWESISSTWAGALDFM